MKLTNNIVVIGGPISSGKSSLVKNLDFPKVMEIDKKDEILMVLWEETYKKNRIAPEVIEFYFLELRKKRYQNFGKKNDNLYIFDRSIFESIIFAKKNLNSKSYKFFVDLWEAEIKNLILNYGKPLLYVVLEINWQTFKNRFFNRGYKIETKYFDENKDFFKSHVEQYTKSMIYILKKFKIHYQIINTNNLSVSEVSNLVKEKIINLKK